MNNMLAIVAVLLLPAYLCSCSVSKKINRQENKRGNTDSTDVFVPAHPPVVVGKNWREVMNENK